jgi:hypothetical protein
MGRGRITIGLYNSYDSKKFREPHRRVIARTGGIAMAFDMNLALFGFPVPEDQKTPVEIAEWIAGTTSIGGNGEYFVELAEKGRFSTFPYPSKGFPPQLGEPILTTCSKDESRSVDASWIADKVRNGSSVLLIFGIGPHGTPKDVMSLPNYVFDVTGGNYSLETCIAIGAVSGAINALLNQ